MLYPTLNLFFFSLGQRVRICELIALLNSQPIFISGEKKKKKNSYLFFFLLCAIYISLFRISKKKKEKKRKNSCVIPRGYIYRSITVPRSSLSRAKTAARHLEEGWRVNDLASRGWRRNVVALKSEENFSSVREAREEKTCIDIYTCGTITALIRK